MAECVEEDRFDRAVVGWVMVMFLRSRFLTRRGRAIRDHSRMQVGQVVVQCCAAQWRLGVLVRSVANCVWLAGRAGLACRELLTRRGLNPPQSDLSLFIIDVHLFFIEMAKKRKSKT
jgi:hypothetical protein